MAQLGAQAVFTLDDISTKDEGSGTGAGFGTIVLILTGVCAVFACLLTLLYVQRQGGHNPTFDTVATNHCIVQPQIRHTPSEELPQTSPPAPCHPHLHARAHLQRRIVGISHLDTRRVLD